MCIVDYKWGLVVGLVSSEEGRAVHMGSEGDEEGCRKSGTVSAGSVARSV